MKYVLATVILPATAAVATLWQGPGPGAAGLVPGWSSPRTPPPVAPQQMVNPPPVRQKRQETRAPHPSALEEAIAEAARARRAEEAERLLAVAEASATAAVQEWIGRKRAVSTDRERADAFINEQLRRTGGEPLNADLGPIPPAGLGAAHWWRMMRRHGFDHTTLYGSAEGRTGRRSTSPNERREP